MRARRMGSGRRGKRWCWRRVRARGRRCMAADVAPGAGCLWMVQHEWLRWSSPISTVAVVRLGRMTFVGEWRVAGGWRGRVAGKAQAWPDFTWKNMGVIVRRQLWSSISSSTLTTSNNEALPFPPGSRAVLCFIGSSSCIRQRTRLYPPCTDTGDPR